MAAGDQQRAEVFGQLPPVEDAHAHVRDQVVDGIQRLAGGQGQGLGRGDAHHQGAGQTGAAGDRNGIDVGQCHSGFLERRGKRRDEGVEMGAGGDLGNDAAEAHVLFHGGGHGVDQQLGAAHDTHPGFITGGFNAKNERSG